MRDKIDKIENNPVFYESQQFRQWWMWILLIVIELTVVFFVFGLFAGKVNPDRPVNLIIAILVMIIPSLIIALIYMMKLDTKINNEGVFVRFSPIFSTYKFYPWHSISDIYLRTYSPLREFGGYGMRYRITERSRAYNISGNQGIQIELKDGSKVLLGTQKPQEAQATIDAFFLR